MAEDTSDKPNTDESTVSPDTDHNVEEASTVTHREKEIGGREGPDPTRYGDWEKNGRCIDF